MKKPPYFSLLDAVIICYQENIYINYVFDKGTDFNPSAGNDMLQCSQLIEKKCILQNITLSLNLLLSYISVCFTNCFKNGKPQNNPSVWM